MAQQNRIKSPEIDTHKYSQLMFGKGRKPMQWNEYSLSKWCLTTGRSQEKKIFNLDLDITSLTNINSKFKRQAYKASRKYL